VRKIRTVKTELEKNLELQKKLKGEIKTADNRSTDDIAQDVNKLMDRAHGKQAEMTKECEDILHIVETAQRSSRAIGGNFQL